MLCSSALLYILSVDTMLSQTSGCASRRGYSVAGGTGAAPFHGGGDNWYWQYRCCNGPHLVEYRCCQEKEDVGGTCKPGFCVNEAAQNVCDDPSYARINDEEGCQNVASTLGLQYGGAHQLDYCARGCFVYDGEYSESHGVYFNTHPQGGETADHHLICAPGERGCDGVVQDR